MSNSLTRNHNIGLSNAVRLCVELFRGLVCKSEIEESLEMSLPPLVDLAWHQAILNTRLYREMCESVFGRFLEHTTETSKDSVEVKNARVRKTEVMYEKLFGEKVPEDLWKKEEEQEEEEKTVLRVRRKSKGSAGEKKQEKEENTVSRKNISTKRREEGAANDVVVDLTKEETKTRKKARDVMLIIVKSLTGKATWMEVDASLTVLQLKQLYEEKEGIPTIQQRLIFTGMRLKDERTLKDYTIQNGDIVHVVSRLTGC